MRIYTRIYESNFTKKQNIKKVRIPSRPGTKLQDYLRLIFLAGELALRWNQIYPSLLNTYEKLKKLGYIYSNNKVIFTEEM